MPQLDNKQSVSKKDEAVHLSSHTNFTKIEALEHILRPPIFFVMLISCIVYPLARHSRYSQVALNREATASYLLSQIPDAAVPFFYNR